MKNVPRDITGLFRVNRLDLGLRLREPCEAEMLLFVAHVGTADQGIKLHRHLPGGFVVTGVAGDVDFAWANRKLEAAEDFAEGDNSFHSYGYAPPN